LTRRNFIRYIAGFYRTVVPVAALLAVWSSVCLMSGVDDKLLPTPKIVFFSILEMAQTGELISDVLASLGRVICGFSLGALFAIFLGWVTATVKSFDILLGGTIQLIRPLPPISLVPMIILWMGINEGSKVFLVALGVFFPVWISTHLGIQGVDQRYLWVARVHGVSRWATAFEVMLPAAMPTIVSGLRTSIATAFFCLVAAELAGAVHGVVFRINLSHLAFRTDKMLGGLVVLGLISAVTDSIFAAIVRALFPWLSAEKKAGGL
jgi:ABC-type nitrate/sulfonate/bicarbonate transport system permease component